MANAPIDRGPVLEKINAAFTARDAGYDATWPGYTARLELLNKRMNALIAAHTSLPISQQISLEAQWLIHYTDDWTRAAATLDRLEASLGGGNQPFVQQPDGSWGAGCTEFYRKLEPTVDFLQSNEIQKPKPGKKLTLLPLGFHEAAAGSGLRDELPRTDARQPDTPDRPQQSRRVRLDDHVAGADLLQEEAEVRLRRAPRSGIHRSRMRHSPTCGTICGACRAA